MRTSELVVATYAAYVALMALRARVPPGNRLLVWLSSAATLGGVVVLRVLPQNGPVTLARDWAPAAYILIGYYAAGLLYVGESQRFEQWLARCDARLLGDWRPDMIATPVKNLFEIAYMATFLLIPAGFAVLTIGGFRRLADRYWTTVSIAELGAFGVLPLLPSRPPWLLDMAQRDRGSSNPASNVRRLGLTVVRRTSHCANTFPSGHTSGSLAIALAVLPVMPVAGVVLLIIALAIALGCVTGRYHYAVDVLAGAILALTAWSLVHVSGV